MTIKELSRKTIEEIEKSNKEAYPLYYKEMFILLATENRLQIDPFLCMESYKDLSSDLLKKTKETVEFIEETNNSIADNSQTLIQEFEVKNVNGEILDLMKNFEDGLIDIVHKSNKKINELNAELDKVYKQLHIDAVTKAYNRKALEEDLNKLVKVGQKKRLDTAVLAFDFDHFKNINDTYGHLVGDFVLKKISSIVKSIIREEDKLYRFGGDEFVIIFNRINRKAIEKIAEKIRHIIEHKKLKYKDNILNITLSIGVTCHHLGDTKDSFLQRADEALYASKRDRNKVTILC